MRRALLVLGVMAALPWPGLAAAQGQVGQGERVDVTAAEFPPLVVAGRVFYINVTVVNRDTVRHNVVLATTLYGGSSDTPCEGARSRGNVSMFANSLSLDPGQRIRVDGAAEHWGHVVNASRVAADGPVELCVWVRLGSCPEFTPACFLDFHPAQVPVRLRNAPPAVRIEVEPGPDGTTQTQFLLRARGEDADGDALSYRWLVREGVEPEGPILRQRFGAGTHVVTLRASDGWDTAEATATLRVKAEDGPAPGDKGAPGPGLPLLALAALLALLTRGPGRASPGPRRRARRGARRGP